MKAFKLASAFAVTGLALAISGQAMAADTTTDWTWEGEVVFAADLMNNNSAFERLVADNSTVKGSRGANGNSDADLAVSIAVANGGFSATMDIDDGGVDVSDFVYEEGAFMFGEIGQIGGVEGAVDGMNEGHSYASDQGFRYTSGGLQVQAFGGINYTTVTTTSTVVVGTQSYTFTDTTDVLIGGTDMGLAVAYAGTSGNMAFELNAQYAETAATDAAQPMYFGGSVTAAVSDSVEVVAAYTTGGLSDVSSYGVRADYTGDAFTAYLTVADNDGSAKQAAGVAATVGAFALTADYDIDSPSLDLGASTSGSADAMSYTASLDLEDVTGTMAYEAAVGVAFAASDMMSYDAGYLMRNGDSTELTASATYTTEGGATMVVAYELDNGASTSQGSDSASNNALTFTASYSF